MKLSKKYLKITNSFSTPFLTIKLDVIKKKFEFIKKFFDTIYVATKANNHIECSKLLNSLNSSFDAASINEINTLLNVGINPCKISFGNTIKKESDIIDAYKKGIKLFSVDSKEEILKLAKYAPNSYIFHRFIVNEELYKNKISWPMNDKFGNTISKCISNLILAKNLGLLPYGISFHVGSQATDERLWFLYIDNAKIILDKLNKKKIELKMLNIGGGFPINYLRNRIKKNFLYNIKTYIMNNLKNYNLIIAAEPGRYVYGESGVICSEIILKTKRLGSYWLYIDCGIFNGMYECTDNIKYDISYINNNKEKILYNIAGPTCDGKDIIYRNVYLPKNLKIGDKLYFMNCGAYTSEYNTSFNKIYGPQIYIL